MHPDKSLETGSYDLQFNAWRTQELSLEAFAARSVIEIQPLLRHA
jgi:hypothetical protein